MKKLSVAILLVSIFPTSLFADFVGVSWLGQVYRIDQTTGTAAVINDFAMAFMNSLARDSHGRLFTIGGLSRRQLAMIDQNTGDVLSSVTLPIADFRAAAFSPTDQLYATHTIDLPFPQGFQTELMLIDVEAATVQSLGVFDLGIGAMAFRSDGTLYAWDIGASGQADGYGLITLATDGSGFTDVNPSVGTPSAEIQTIEFSPDGILYGDGTRLFTIDIASGTWTPISDEVNFLDIRGIAYVPEPASIAIACGGLFLIPMRRLRA